MKINSVGKWLIAAAVAPFVLFSSGAFSYAEHLETVRKEIRERGKHWVADETVNTRIPEYANGSRVGLIKPKLTGVETMATVAAPVAALPAGFDWSTGGTDLGALNYVTPPRDQGNCGSCWAFATAGALESYTLLKGGDNTCSLGGCDLSEQMLLTCSGAGNCSQGGYIDRASNYIRDTGLVPETCYPYDLTTTNKCLPCPSWASQVHKIDAWAYVATTAPTVSAIKNALAATGPLVTTMDVYQDFYDYYAGGVYSYTSGAYVGGHAIVIVGYQDDSTLPGGGYFRVKNSWGTGWGNAGFFNIAYSEVGSVVNFGDWTIAYLTASAAGFPATPSNLTATAVSSSQINLAWADNATNETGFKIERCTGTGCTNFTQIATVGANVLAYANSGLAPGTTYTYRVRAYNAAGNSAYSTSAYAATQPLSLPIVPSGLTATAVSSSQINLAWVDNATNETGFKIERCTGTPCTFAQIATVGANVKTYSNKSLRKSTTYTYRVRAYNAAGNSAYSNNAGATTKR